MPPFRIAVFLLLLLSMSELLNVVLASEHNACFLENDVGGWIPLTAIAGALTLSELFVAIIHLWRRQNNPDRTYTQLSGAFKTVINIICIGTLLHVVWGGVHIYLIATGSLSIVDSCRVTYTPTTGDSQTQELSCYDAQYFDSMVAYESCAIALFVLILIVSAAVNAVPGKAYEMYGTLHIFLSIVWALGAISLGFILWLPVNVKHPKDTFEMEINDEKVIGVFSCP